MKSKLSGARQVYYTALRHLSRGRFPRRCRTCVRRQQTCEQCHWPKKFWGAQLKTFTHFGDDETEHAARDPHADQDGRRRPSLGQAGDGIHWHMNIANEITILRHRRAAPEDPLRQREDRKGR